jgi:deazaflavin-dependent oxidoreductase (nitroreductase family)
MSERSERNRAVIEEFRANRGSVGGQFGGGGQLLLLTTKGRKTGQSYTTPVGYLRDNDRIYVFGSKGGAPEHPDWYRNLVATPEVTVEIGGETYQARASTVEGPERERLYARQVERAPVFGDYQKNTKRQIPVIALERLS